MRSLPCALECGSLLPLFSGELARPCLAASIPAYGRQAGLEESGSKLPHSKGRRYIATYAGSMRKLISTAGAECVSAPTEI